MKIYIKPELSVCELGIEDILSLSNTGKIEAVDLTFDWEGENERW